MDKLKKYFELAKTQALPISLDEANKMIDDFNDSQKREFSINIKRLIIMVSTVVSILTVGFFVVNSFNINDKTNQEKPNNTDNQQIISVNNEGDFLKQEEQEENKNTFFYKDSEKQQIQKEIIQKEEEKNSVNNSYPINNSFINDYNYFAYSIDDENPNFDTIITKEIDISNTKAISLISWYSNTRIKIWSENKIKIVASYTIKAKEKNKVIFLNNIDLLVYKNNENIIINNNLFYNPKSINNSKITLHNGEEKYYKRKKFNQFEFDNEVESNIDYVWTNFEIFVPKDFNLDIKNIIGNVDIPETNGNVKVNISGGTLTTEKINKNLNLEIAYANANITSFNKGHLDIFISDVTFNSCKSLYFKSHKSNIKGSIVKDSLSIDAHKSVIKINESGISTIDATHSQFEFGKMKKLELFGHKDSVAIDRINNFQSDIDNSIFYFGNVKKMIVGNNKSTYTIVKADTIIAKLTQGSLNVETLKYLYFKDIYKEKFTIQELNTLKGTASQSVIKIDLIKNNIDLKDYKSLINIGIADNKFKKISLDLEKTDISIKEKNKFSFEYKFYVSNSKVEMTNIVTFVSNPNKADWGTYKSDKFESAKTEKIDITAFKSKIKVLE